MVNANWHDVLDQQLRLWNKGHVELTLMGEAMPPELRGPDADADAKSYVEAVIKAATGALAYAVPVHVGDGIAELWNAARRDFQPEPYQEHEAFVPDGFALLPNAYDLDHTALTRALLWSEFPGGCVVYGLAHGADYTPPTDQPWVITWSGALRDEHAGGVLSADEVGGPAGALSAVQAFWRLGREFTSGTERVTRAQRREARRAGLEHAEEVTMLRLRRHVKVAADAQATYVNYTCQWIVRGHWRNQWHPSLGEHRQRYIAPHIKGPADKPLRITDRAVEFTQ